MLFIFYLRQHHTAQHADIHLLRQKNKKLQHQLQDEILPYKEENKKGKGVEDEEEKGE